MRLTFDDGPGEITEPLLDLLARHRVQATFFVVGQSAGARPEVLARMVGEGHEVGNHSWDHARLPQVAVDEVREQLIRTSAAIETATARKPRLFRPPYGQTTMKIRAIAAELGMQTMLWDVDTEDFRLPGAEAISGRILAARRGDVVLLHDGRGPRAQTLDGVGRALAQVAVTRGSGRQAEPMPPRRSIRHLS
jgi:peptidoglycan/xylan/chitin deacetylase (PgdA/CDA1 family)